MLRAGAANVTHLPGIPLMLVRQPSFLPPGHVPERRTQVHSTQPRFQAKISKAEITFGGRFPARVQGTALCPQGPSVNQPPASQTPCLASVFHF